MQVFGYQMMTVAEQLRPLDVPIMVSMNPIMIDGTGMCGGCRVGVGGESKFTCVHGPEFDGHQVDFDLLAKRLKVYPSEEEKARASYQPKPK